LLPQSQPPRHQLPKPHQLPPQKARPLPLLMQARLRRLPPKLPKPLQKLLPKLLRKPLLKPPPSLLLAERSNNHTFLSFLHPPLFQTEAGFFVRKIKNPSQSAFKT
jgi:hypothetical protein